jgi:hypothetical protein
MIDHHEQQIGAREVADKLLSVLAGEADPLGRGWSFKRACDAAAYQFGLAVTMGALKLILTRRGVVVSELSQASVGLPPFAAESDILVQAAMNVVATGRVALTRDAYVYRRDAYGRALHDQQTEKDRRQRSRLRVLAGTDLANPDDERQKMPPPQTR